MLSVARLNQIIQDYNHQFQALTARIYADGFVSCQEAADGTAYYQAMRPRLRRVQRAARRRTLALYGQYAARIFLQLTHKRQHQLAERGNVHLERYRQALQEIEQLLTDAEVMLKIFADVLRDCD